MSDGQVELDIDRKKGFPIRAELGKRTGRTSVPSIWIGGQFIGGCNDGPVLAGGTLTQVILLKFVFSLVSKIKILFFICAFLYLLQSKSGGLVALNESGELRNLLIKSGALKAPSSSSGLNASSLLSGASSYLSENRPYLFFSLPFLLYFAALIAQ